MVTSLVVDDDPHIASVVGRGLRFEGFAVRTASDGPQALRSAREDPPDLVVFYVILYANLLAEIDDRLPRSDEVGQLAATVNNLVATVARTLEQQRTLLADTSHELRSPLTVVLVNLDLLGRDLALFERAVCIQEATTEAQRMRRLVQDLLLLAQADTTQVIARAPVALDTLVETTTFITPGLVVDGDYERLTQALRNLLDNAVRYTLPPASLQVQLLAQPDGQAYISVSDTGPGIEATHLPYLWDRFYRVDKARSRAAGGSGLGLAIVKYIVDAHQGQVGVESSPGQGATFWIRLPLVNQTANLPTAAWINW